MGSRDVLSETITVSDNSLLHNRAQLYNYNVAVTAR